METLEARQLLAADVVINEIHYDPADKQTRSEFIELVNAGDAVADLSGWRFSDGIDFQFDAGTTLSPGEYLVVAQDTDDFQTVFAPGEPPVRPAVGPWTGRLNNDGEQITLRNADGAVVDTVDYGVGFPWPTASRGGGSSMELIHPSLDNDLGGSWRASGFTANESTTTEDVFFDSGAQWKFFKGVTEPSVPTTSWREPEFDDSTWLQGNTPVGYGEAFISTPLDDMRDAFSTVYFRRTFQVTDHTAFNSLILAARFDDGINVWINGAHVAGENTPGEFVPFDGTASGSRSNESAVQEIHIDNYPGLLADGENLIVVQLLNVSLSSNDAFFDAGLIASNSSPSGGGLATPVRRNSVWIQQVPPQIRQVRHTPDLPAADQEVLITAKVTDPDGVANVELTYQTVDPGSYINRSDRRFETGWTALAMRDDGVGADAVAGDSIFSAALPASIQQHRRLLRYRITVADTLGNSIRTPYEDDDQPNFAYFVYDGAPAWTGADQPGVTPPVTYGTDVTRSLPAYHLISRETDVVNSQYNPSFNTKEFRFEGTLVIGSQVYDHIRYRIRGQNSTYVAGKNKWKLKFNRGHYFEGFDQYGNPWPEKLQTLNFGTAASPWAPANRGLAGMDEALSFRLFNMAGVAAPNLSAFQLRVIDAAEEASATDQYEGDLWGLYVAFENPERQFLNAHDLPDGNLFRMQVSGELENHGFGLPGNGSDVAAFVNAYNRNPVQAAQWWRDNVDLDGYYSYRSVVEAVNHSDIRDRQNMLLYFNPDTDHWSMLPWDLDLLFEEFDRWGPNGVQNASTLEQFRKALQHPELNIEFENRARELQDLLLNADQGAQVVEEYARHVEAFAAIDRTMWDYNPRSNSSPANRQHFGAFYEEISVYPAGNGAAGEVRRAISPVGFEGMVNWVKEFISQDGFGGGRLANMTVDRGVPNTPTLSFVGAAGFPADDLRFQTSPFSDPQDDETFAAIQWRVGEVTDPLAPNFDPMQPWVYEIDAVWESGEITTFQDQITVPGSAVQPGHAYRARVRMKDDTGRWSHWSEAVQFIATEAQSPSAAGIVITELMFHPADPSPQELAAGFTNDDDFEFVELLNISDAPVDLSGVRFSDGIQFDFSGSNVTSLNAGEYVVVVNNQAAFTARYGSTHPVAGEYSGRLSNAGERLLLEDGLGRFIHDFEYADNWYPTTDGDGPSLVIVDPTAAGSAWNEQTGWRPSAASGGSPGGADGRSGDANGDGRVDVDDLNAVRNHFGAGDGTDLTGIPGDAFPFDGRVDINDLNLVRNHFGAAAAAPVAVDAPVGQSLAPVAVRPRLATPNAVPFGRPMRRNDVSEMHRNKTADANAADGVFQLMGETRSRQLFLKLPQRAVDRSRLAIDDTQSELLNTLIGESFDVGLFPLD